MKYLKRLLFLSILFSLGCGANGRPTNQSLHQFPPLTGSYEVGRTQLDMIDSSREEIYTSDKHDVREFTITIFYPTESTENAERAIYVEESLIDAIAESTEVPPYVFQSFQPRSYANTAVADGEFPVILFSPGFGVPIIAYTGQMEDLASHGYIVIGISHTYAVPAIMLSDGRVLRASDSLFPTLEEALETPEDGLVFIEEVLSVWVDDMLFTLNQLETLNTTHNLLTNHLDLLRIGAVGHSLGGATAFAAAYEDARILAAVDMDGSLYGDVVEHGLDRPAMVMAQDVTILTELGVPAEVIEGEMASYATDRASALKRATPGYDIIVTNASHGVFATDALVIANAFPELATPDLVGHIKDLLTVRGHIHDTVLTFFDAYVAQTDKTSINNLKIDGFDITVFNQQ